MAEKRHFCPALWNQLKTKMQNKEAEIKTWRAAKLLWNLYTGEMRKAAGGACLQVAGNRQNYPKVSCTFWKVKSVTSSLEQQGLSGFVWCWAITNSVGQNRMTEKVKLSTVPAYHLCRGKKKATSLGGGRGNMGGKQSSSWLSGTQK